MDVRAEEVIDAPRAEVAAFAMDPRNDTAWIANIREATPLTPLPVTKGTRVSRVAFFLGKRVEYVLEVTEHAPGARLAMASVAGPFPMRVAYEFEDAPAGRTRARIVLGGDASPYFRLFRPLLARLSQRNIQRDLRKLKALLEARR